MLFVFKHKTASELRIGDWSSDVCSSDLLLAPVHVLLLAVLAVPSIYVLWLSLNISGYGTGFEFVGLKNYVTIFSDLYFWRALWNTFKIGGASCRERVCQYV